MENATQTNERKHDISEKKISEPQEKRKKGAPVKWFQWLITHGNTVKQCARDKQVIRDLI